MRKGTAYLPLHGGKCPPWLFKRMKNLCKVVSEIIIEEYGRNEFLKRISDPFFFQSFGCLVGFDWHSSGLTTTLCGALKEALSVKEHGIGVCGGKGKVSRRTPEEIEKIGEKLGIPFWKIEKMKYASKMSAKVDNSLIQDGYHLYHHVFFFTKDKWAVVQQGMSENGWARRYHWLSGIESFVIEPHQGIVGEKENKVLDMTSRKSKECQKICVDVVKDGTNVLKKMVNEIREKVLFMPKRINWNVLREAYEIQPRNYEELISIKGIGPGIIRALALVSELIYGEPPSWEDPVKFSFAHGGKDGVPYPVNKERMDRVIEILKKGIEEAKIGDKEKLRAIRRLKEMRILE